ncbi:MAG TPA: hypothetical protein VKR42_03180 [Ktedonobacteraceae bacterium]|nr:hypothetical protein [Ktedonobacteraceae bacterium]
MSQSLVGVRFSAPSGTSRSDVPVCRTGLRESASHVPVRATELDIAALVELGALKRTPTG